MHKSIFPIYPIEFLGLVCLPILIGFANVGGIGGGGLTIPLLITFWGFNTKESIALSGFMQFIGAVVRYFYSFNSKHPEKSATHIDYGIVIVMLPLVVLGSFLGVLINIILPPVILSIMLTVLLVILTIQASIQAVKIFKKESIIFKQNQTPNFKVHKAVLDKGVQAKSKVLHLPDIKYIQ